MTRLLATSVSSYVSRPVVNLYTLADVVLDSGTIRVWNGPGYLMVGANTYSGIGDLGNVEPIKEDLSEFPRTIKATFAAVTSSNLLAEALAENLFNRTITFYRAWWLVDEEMGKLTEVSPSGSPGSREAPRMTVTSGPPPSPTMPGPGRPET